MSDIDNSVSGSQGSYLNDCSRPGTKTLSHSLESGSQDSSNSLFIDTDSQHVSSCEKLQFEFFDQEEQERREEYRHRVEKHYCRLIEEERLSPESASVLSDAFAEAEVRAKFGTTVEKFDLKPEYHPGIDKKVWQEIDHQRSKSLERLKSYHNDDISNGHYDNYTEDKGTLNMDQFNNDEQEFIENDADLDSNLTRDMASFETEKQKTVDSRELNSEEISEGSKNVGGLYDHCKEMDASYTSKNFNVENNDDDDSDDDDDSETLESVEDRTDSDESDDEFDFNNDAKREWRSKHGDLALEKSMGAWLGSPRGHDYEDGSGKLYYKKHLENYKEKVAAKERERLTELLKQSSSVPSASPTPMDYDADEELSAKETPRSSLHSLSQWSEGHVKDTKCENNSPSNDRSKLCYDFLPKPVSCKSSVCSEKSRVDHSTYQSYTAGLLHSSGKSEKFLKLQKHFAVLERIRDIEAKSPQISPTFVESRDCHKLYAKYDVQSMEELQWLYQELSEARRNEEFFYDLQKLEVYQWKPSRDSGLKRKGKSLNDLKKFYEHLDEEEKESEDNQLQNSFFRHAMNAEKLKKGRKAGKQKITDTSKFKKKLERAASSPKILTRPLYGTHIPEKLDDYEILVEAKKQKNKEEHCSLVDNLHVRSLSAPYSKHLQDASAADSTDQGHKRSDSFKGALFSRHSFPKKSNPTVAEVTPVPRQVSQKPPVYPKIMSGPHDFASHATATETVARPMQSNLHIYNSLENPQYKATANLDEPVRRLSRGRSNDNFIVQRAADGSYTVTAADRSISRQASQDRFFNTELQNNWPIEMGHQSLLNERFPQSENTGQQTMRPKEMYSLNKTKSVPDVSLVNTTSFKHSTADVIPKTSVRDVVAKIENKNDKECSEIHTTMNSPMQKRKLLPKSKTTPDLMLNRFVPGTDSSFPDSYNKRSTIEPSMKKKFDEDNGHVISEMSIAPLSASEGPPRTLVSTVFHHSMPTFKITNLRPLANNNEFCSSKFFPKSSSSQYLSKPVQTTEPVLHKPVVSQIFGRDDRDERRISVSSNDTFIVNDSDDENEDRFKYADSIGRKNTLDQCRSKSEPDLTEQDGAIRPRSAKSHIQLNVDNPSEQSWIPNTDSYDLDGRYMLSKGREKVRSENMYKTSDERETSCSPCSADEMTMNYLQEIETEWAEIKGSRSKWNKENDSNTNECVTLPNVETFVGSDTTVSPNRWIPSLEVKKCAIDKSKTRNFNDIDAERNKIVESDDQMSDTFVSKKFLTLPRSHKLNPSSAEGVGYSTIPRMRPDVQTNKARDKQIHTNRSEANFAFRHLTTEELRSQHRPSDKDQRRREEEESYRKRRLEQIYEEERRKKILQQQADIASRKHSDFLLPSQKSPIPNDRFEYGTVPEDRRRGFKIQGKAKGLYNFTAHNSRELAFRKGDILYLIRQIDANWFEGERNGRIGIFPVNYVEVLTSIEEASTAARQSEGQARAKYTFNSQTSVELPLNKGDIVTLLRNVDDNWFEGRVGNRQGIFPVAYVEVLQEPSTPLITPAPSVITTPMTGRGTPEMLSPVSYDGAPTPPPQPSPGAFTMQSDNLGSRYATSPRDQHFSQQQDDSRLRSQRHENISPQRFEGVQSQRHYDNSLSSRHMNGGYSSPQQHSFSDFSARSQRSPQQIRKDNPPSLNITAKSVSTPNVSMTSKSRNFSKGTRQEEDLAIARYRAIYAYRPQNEDELELLEGDEIYVMEKCDDGWYVGTSGRTGMFGTFPGNYVTRSQ